LLASVRNRAFTSAATRFKGARAQQRPFDGEGYERRYAYNSSCRTERKSQAPSRVAVRVHTVPSRDVPVQQRVRDGSVPQIEIIRN